MDGGGNVVQGNFSALGHAGSDSYVGLEIIVLDELMDSVTFNSDEFTAVCPVTGQPDQYELTIVLADTLYSIESKSLKIYLNTFRNKGAFCENLAGEIRKEIFNAISNRAGGGPIFHEAQVSVSVMQKRRGGISIEAII